MRNKKLSLGIRVALTICAATLLVAGTRAAGQESVLYNFTGGTIGSSDGRNPYGNLILDSSGNLYGTASSAGGGGGLVFELSPVAGGGWSEKILYSFMENGKDGVLPLAGLIFDSAGNLYGTTHLGGAYNYGTVFELQPSSGGTWKEGVLHSFNDNGKDGIYPGSGLTLDASGNLYGTTPNGGVHGGGTVFELTPKSNGGWAEKVLCSFPNPLNNYSNGPNNASLIFDSSGNLYGTTVYWGAHNSGSVFELSPTKSGTWTPKLLHSFEYDGTDGFFPEGGLVFDSSGNLYGTTDFGGGDGAYGTVFELSPLTGGGWTEKVLYAFGTSNTGSYPTGTPIFDSAGNLYGTTFSGGSYGGGAVFELTSSAGGTWTENLLHSFGNGADGSAPWGGVVLDSQGNLYGATLDGGADGSGTVFEVTP
ncbi:MAG: choice-of-anchor tandem repeat GloVer-containing protein [Candidatus Sulfotelmatobacter sp.]|jgi:uncharacterized repeat protein (TIGR03803 family)